MNVDDPKLTAYALNELDEPEQSAIARATADSPEGQRFVAETQELARALRSQYRLELHRGLIAPGKLAAIHGDAFWSKNRTASDCRAPRCFSCGWGCCVQQ